MQQYLSYYSYFPTNKIRVEENNSSKGSVETIERSLEDQYEIEECDNCGNRYLLGENDRIVKIWELHLIPFIKATPIIRRIYGSEWICSNCRYENLAYNFMRFGGRSNCSCIS